MCAWLILVASMIGAAGLLVVAYGIVGVLAWVVVWCGWRVAARSWRVPPFHATDLTFCVALVGSLVAQLVMNAHASHLGDAAFVYMHAGAMTAALRNSWFPRARVLRGRRNAVRLRDDALVGRARRR